MDPFKLTDNPFRRKKNAEQMDFEEIYSLFADPPDYHKYLQPRHHIMIGSTGSGKSAVLKALSLPVQLKRDRLEHVPFYGIYLRLKNPEVKHFVRIYEDYEDSNTFEHFLCVDIALEFLEQFRSSLRNDKDEILGIASRIINEEYMLKIMDANVDKVIERLKGIKRIIRNSIINNILIENLSRQMNMKVINLDLFISIIERINDELLSKIGKQKLCLLIDKYDYLKSLSRVLNVFLDQSLEETLCVKFAVRYLPELFGSDISGRKIDLKRDMEILSLDHNPDDPQYKDLLKHIANNVIAQLQGTSNIVDLLSCETPPEIISAIDKNATPGENLRQLHRLERGKARNMRQKLCYGFNCLTTLSGGNILNFLNLCEKAIDNEMQRNREMGKGINLVSAKSQANASVSLASIVFNKDINVEIGEEFREIRSFIYSLGKECERKGMESNLFEGSAFSIPPNIGEGVANILRKGFLRRFFLCSPEDLIAMNLNKDYIPERGALSPLLAPRFGTSWINKGEIPLTKNKIIEYMLFPITDQPDADTYYGEKKLLPEDPVFISISIKDDKKCIERCKLLKTTVNNIYKQDTRNRMRLVGLSGREICVTARDLWKQDLHRFTADIPKIVKKAKYIVHDVTPLEYEKERKKEKHVSIGVLFEIGLSLSYKRPFFLYHDYRYEPFDKNKLPKLLRDWDVKKWDPSSPDFKNVSFREWYREAIHQHGFVSREWPCPFENEKLSCDYEDKISKKIKKTYISFQPRNKDQRDFLTDLLATKYKITEISPADYPMDDEACQMCFAMQSCIVKFIDCTEAVEDYVVEIGLCSAVDLSSVLYMYDADLSDHPVLMSRCFPCAWHKNTYKQDIKNALEDFMSKFKLGRRR